MLSNIFKKKSAFIPFLMAGAPSIDIFKQAIISLAQVGSDLIEIGVPFSDPVADGPVNQQAADVALQNGMTLNLILEIIRQFRDQGYQTPIVLFSYLNPILAMGATIFAQKSKAAGVNGVLILDVPPEEGEEIYPILRAAELDIVLLASPTTQPSRFELYAQFDPAFIYYISRCGVTGIQNALVEDLEQQVDRLRTYLPQNQKIVVGFGISSFLQAKQVAEFADGVVVGSHLVKMIQEEGLEKFKEEAQRFSEAIKFQ